VLAELTDGELTLEHFRSTSIYVTGVPFEPTTEPAMKTVTS
jgi:hypothetical protein